ncbi:MAG: DUF1810 domain-containing protein [Acidimicrobiia bacterium]
MPEIDLARFVDVHDDVERALEEIRAGRKQTHWMWFVFPQVAGLGRSDMAHRYAIRSLDEAAAFLTHPALGSDYVRIVEEVWCQVVERGVTIHAMFGSPDDAKLVSSLTLFAGVVRRLDVPGPTLTTFVTRAEDILEAASAQGFERCTTTEAFLRQDGRRSPG